MHHLIFIMKLAIQIVSMHQFNNKNKQDNAPHRQNYGLSIKAIPIQNMISAFFIFLMPKNHYFSDNN